MDMLSGLNGHFFKGTIRLPLVEESNTKIIVQLTGASRQCLLCLLGNLPLSGNGEHLSYNVPRSF